ncbi:hypothetical protein UFOVP185_18 [uncultured Caudovirales phage]|uniref:Uncharacterized protein n=1 Tax=uncultured Caudovirales phage TaxID=2100421 RepID=A0A6J7WJI5_9CAUD|nr:hypothetical protein UFOVP185_18 [uncultured Caudovirales phage]
MKTTLEDANRRDQFFIIARTWYQKHHIELNEAYIQACNTENKSYAVEDFTFEENLLLQLYKMHAQMNLEVEMDQSKSLIDYYFTNKHFINEDYLTSSADNLFEYILDHYLINNPENYSVSLSEIFKKQ